MSAIAIRNLYHSYGSLTAVAGVSFDVPEGSIFGLIGPNGAGKTTTLRVTCTLLVPTAGDVQVMGQSVGQRARAVRRLLGYMPDSFGLYGELRVWEYLDFYARCYGLPPAARRDVIRDTLELVDLGAKRDSYVQGLSRGMMQRLALGRTLLHDPTVLVLDEPAAGLDPRARIELRALLRELQRLGKTILLSSHILSDLAEICSHVAILEQGRLAAQGELQEVLTRVGGGRTVVIELLGAFRPPENVAALIPELEGVSLQAGDRVLLRGIFRQDDAALAAMLERLIRYGMPVVGFHDESSDLESVFMKLTQPMTP